MSQAREPAASGVRPQPPAAPVGSLLKWHLPQQVGGGPDASNAPVVVLLGWMFAPEKALMKYVALVNSLGWACCVFRPRVLPLWVPAWSSATANALLSELEAELAAHGPRPVVFGVFSGAAKSVYYHMLSKLGPVVPVPDLEWDGEHPDFPATPSAPAAAAASSTPSSPAAAAAQAPEASTSAGPVHADSSGSVLPRAAMVAAWRAAVPQPWEHAGAGVQGPPVGAGPYPGSQATPTGPAMEASASGSGSGAAGSSSSGGLVGRVRSSMQWLLGPSSGSSAGAASSTVSSMGATAGSVASSRASASSSSRGAGASRREAAPSPYPLVSACVCGQWFDSAPVDFTSTAGARMVMAAQRARSRGEAGEVGVLRSVPLNLLEAGIGVVAGAMDYVGLEAWEAQRQAMWGALAGSETALQGPSLFCYSWDDEVADPVRIQRLAAALRARGAVVLEQTWPHSEHVSHARRHAQQYREVLAGMLARAQTAFNATQPQRAARIKAAHLHRARRHGRRGSGAGAGQAQGEPDAIQMASAAAGAAVAAAAMVVSIRSKL